MCVLQVPSNPFWCFSIIKFWSLKIRSDWTNKLMKLDYLARKYKINHHSCFYFECLIVLVHGSWCSLCASATSEIFTPIKFDFGFFWDGAKSISQFFLKWNMCKVEHHYMIALWQYDHSIFLIPILFQTRS